MIKVGITGGIGSGKSTISMVFSILGVPVFNSDTQAKVAYTNPKIKAKIISLFGTEVYKNGEFQSALMATKVFGDAEKLHQLNQTIHPFVREAFKAFCKKNKDYCYIINEAAIMMETGLYKNFDQIILVTAPIAIKIERIKKRDRLSAEQIQNRMNNQWEDAKKIPLSDFIITNNEDTLVLPQILKIHEDIIQQSNKSR